MSCLLHKAVSAEMGLVFYIIRASFISERDVIENVRLCM